MAQQKPQSFFSFRVVILLGMTAGISLVVAVILFIGEVPGEIPAVAFADSLGTDAGPFSQIQYGNIVLPAKMATGKKASVKQAPANSTPAKSKANMQQGDEPAVRLAVTQWAAAWSRRDAKSYLACYAAGFSVPEGMSRAAWEAKRKSRITNSHSIKIVLKQVDVSFADGGIATVRFVQDFSADSYSEMGIKKELRLKNENGRWQIFAEKAI